MKQLLTPVISLLALGAFAQEDMPIIFETKLGHKIEHTGTGTEETWLQLRCQR
jgi:hypothetical protein